MNGGRSGSDSGPRQAHSSHPQQQDNPVSSSSIPVSQTSATISSHLDMLSAGQPAVTLAVFRTGADSVLPSQRFSASGGFVSTQLPSVYGIYSQSPSHLTTLQPYSTFLTGFGGASSPAHSFTHGSLTSTPSNHYPQLASYSAVFSSMSSHAQHCDGQVTDRAPRLQEPGMLVSHQTFLPSTAHLAAAGIQYPSIPSSSNHHLSESSSRSPGPAANVHILTSAGKHKETLSSDLHKKPAAKGSSILQVREEETSRDARFYRNSSSLHEDKPPQSPSSYSTGGHVPKVSFDMIVKEYGGRRDCSGRGDYFQTTMSGKERSLKHRILTRPPDSDMPDDLSKMTSMHGLKEEPLVKRQKMSSVASPSAVYDCQASSVHHNDAPRFCQSVGHAACLSASSSVSNPGCQQCSSLSGDQVQQLSPHHRPLSESNSKYKKQQCHSSQPSSSSPPPPPQSPTEQVHSSENPPSHLQYPSHFVKGSIIQLANGTLKRVEDLQTEDFINSAEISADLKVDSSTVVKIEEHPDRGTAMLSFSVGEHQVQVTVEAALEHPFFVFGQGWSSCSVSRTLARYSLDCQKLSVGDICLSLTHKDVNLRAAELSKQQQQDQSLLAGPQVKPERMSCSETSEKQIISPQTTSSSLLSQGSYFNPSSAPSFKLEQADTSILPSSSSSSSSVSDISGKMGPSQSELLPPSSEIVDFVKKDIGKNCVSQRREQQRVESGLKKEMFQENIRANSMASLCSHAPATGSIQASEEGNNGTRGAQKTKQISTSNNSQQ